MNNIFPISKECIRTRKRYQRISRFYNLMEILPEQMYRPWRARLWKIVTGPKVLEVGVGTGKNIAFYPPRMEFNAIDLTPGMLDFARKKARDLKVDVDLRLGDAESLAFPKASFDTVVATFVFCSVPDPVKGLREIRRVLKPGGKLLLIEHVRSQNQSLGKIMDLLDPLTVRFMGPHINRRTVENVREAGFLKIDVTNLNRSGIFKFIVAIN